MYEALCITHEVVSDVTSLRLRFQYPHFYEDTCKCCCSPVTITLSYPGPIVYLVTCDNHRRKLVNLRFNHQQIHQMEILPVTH